MLSDVAAGDIATFRRSTPTAPIFQRCRTTAQEDVTVTAKGLAGLSGAAPEGVTEWPKMWTLPF